MKAGTAVATAASKLTNGSECAERILTIVHRLQQEIKDREVNLQVRISQAIEETQHRVEEQCRTRQEGAVSDAKEVTRKEVTQALLNRFDLEISKLHLTFDHRLNEVVTETEALGQLKIESAVAAAKETLRQEVLEEAKNEYQSKLSEMENVIAQLKENGTAAATEWRAERQQFQERIAKLERALDIANAVRTEKLDDHKELERKLEEAIQSKAQLQLDLQRAVSELNSQTQPSGNDGSDHATHGEVAAIVQLEMVRVRVRLDEIERILADPAVELGSEIRLNRERVELQEYLKGLRYSLGEVTLQSPTLEDPCHA
jgi:hypothetical protein